MRTTKKRVRSQAKQLRFIALDGEALEVTEKRGRKTTKEQRYCLLSSSFGNPPLLNRKGLSTVAVFEWLLDLAQSAKDRKFADKFVMFSMHYDVNQWVRDLPDGYKDDLFAAVPGIEWGAYELSYVPKKIFELKRYSVVGGMRQVTASIKVFDAFSFFGTSFKVACEQFLGETPRAIEWGKKQRGSFSWSDLERVRDYNDQENILLVRMMESIAGWLKQLDLVPRSWYGPSAVAQHCLRTWGIGDDIRGNSKEELPPALGDKFLRAYFGGRFEAFKIGHFDRLYSYDINSAYPAAMRDLPKLDDITKWRKIQTFKQNRFSLYKVEWRLPSTAYIGPFPWRNKHGSVCFPRKGSGWYWFPEVDQALRRWGKKYVTVIRGLEYTGNVPSKLSQKIEETYKLRQELKDSGNPAQYALKITINSLYGKLCQSIGRAEYHCLAYAGYITSATRASLMAAVRGKERGIVSFATDGILSLEPLEDLEISRELGGWEYDCFDKGGLVIMPGLYRLTGDKKKTATRGHRSSLPWVNILYQLNRRGRADIETPLFVTHKLARMQQEKHGGDYLKFVTVTKVINPSQTSKRIYRLGDIRDWRRDHADSEISDVMLRGGEFESYPYEPKEKGGYIDGAAELLRILEEGEVDL